MKKHEFKRIMTNYSFREGDKVLQKLIQSKNKEKKYVRTKHIENQAKKRKINIDYLEKMLLTKEPLGVLSSRKNRFKIFFPSETNGDKNDLIIIIAIESDETIIGVTAYEDSKTKREGIK